MSAAPPSTVLIVEDEVLIAMTLEGSLRRAGFEVTGIASSEEQASQLVGGELPSYAVVDINLGAGGSGLNVGRALHTRGVVVLYATAHCPELGPQMLETGARGCLGKPFGMDAVPRALEALALILGGKRPERLPPSLHLFG